MAHDAYAIGARENDTRICVTPEVPHHVLRCHHVPQSRADEVASQFPNGVRDERMRGFFYKLKGADHRTVRGWVDQGLSARRAVERSTGDMRQNGRVTVRTSPCRVGRAKLQPVWDWSAWSHHPASARSAGRHVRETMGHQS
jgi:hypothetical protein